MSSRSKNDIAIPDGWTPVFLFKPSSFFAIEKAFKWSSACFLNVSLSSHALSKLATLPKVFGMLSLIILTSASESSSTIHAELTT